MSYRGIYLLNTLTKLFEGLMEARLSKFTEFNDTLTPSQQGSRIFRQTHDAMYALIATIQERSQYGSPSYCCFIDFATAYPSVHRERLGLTHKKIITSLEKFGTYSKKTPDVYSMPSSTKTMKWIFSAASQKEADLAPPSLVMMIAFITIKSSLVPLIEGLCAQIYFRFEISVVCSNLLLFFFVKEKIC